MVYVHQAAVSYYRMCLQNVHAGCCLFQGASLSNKALLGVQPTASLLFADGVLMFPADIGHQQMHSYMAMSWSAPEKSWFQGQMNGQADCIVSAAVFPLIEIDGHKSCCDRSMRYRLLSVPGLCILPDRTSCNCWCDRCLDRFLKSKKQLVKEMLPRSPV